MDAESLMARKTIEVYRTPSERAAYRAGMSTAAAVCDNIAERERKQSRGAISERLSAVAKKCGDEIWRLRETINVK